MFEQKLEWAVYYFRKYWREATIATLYGVTLAWPALASLGTLSISVSVTLY